MFLRLIISLEHVSLELLRKEVALEWLRREVAPQRFLPRKESVAYFENAKACVVERQLPESWTQMVYTLLKKKYGDHKAHVSSNSSGGSADANDRRRNRPSDPGA